MFVMSFNVKCLLSLILLISSLNCLPINLHETTREVLKGFLCRSSNETKCNVEDELASTKIPETDGVSLICRSNTFLSYEWPQFEHELYLIEIKEMENDWKFYETTKTNLTILTNLSENSSYKIRIWILNEVLNIIQKIYLSNWTSTFGFDEVPDDLKDANIKRLTGNNTNQVVLSWTPADDRPCIYEILWIDSAGDEILDVNVAETGSFEVTLDPIDLNEYYTIFVMAKSEREENESNKTEVHLKPACFDEEMTRNRSICKKPGTPDDLQAETFMKKENVYDVRVTWTKSNHTSMPDSYIVELIAELDFNNYTGTELNVSSDARSVTFKDVRLWKRYEIYLFEVLDGVRSKPAILTNYVQDTTRLVRNIDVIWIVILPIVILIGCVSLALYFLLIKTNKKLTMNREIIEKMRDNDESRVEKEEIERPSDKWEVDLTRLSIGELLGNGAFGVVKKGWLQMDDGSFDEVAVKTLNVTFFNGFIFVRSTDNSTEEDKKQFLAEIDIMKSVGFHRHLVSFLGCHTRVSVPVLIVEYCARGDLKTYLQNAWNILTELNSKQFNGARYENQAEDFANKLYDIQNVTLPKPVELVSFARQIAIGMEYLSSLHVLHRDLAARNVLICADGVAKVSDFGLSRDVYRDNIYYKSSGGKLPIKWMAIESLTHQIYTSQSDVWSYGILLWEIVTFGANPYPGIFTHELLTLLESGLRMEKPDGCSDELYNLMRNCWLRNPKDRPTFTAIKNKLDYIMEDATQYLLLDSFHNKREAKDDDDDDTSSVDEKTSNKLYEVDNERYVQP